MSERRLKPNAIKEVTPYIVPNPVGIDMVVKGLQAEYTEKLDWLEKSFARAVIRSEQREDPNESDVITGSYIYPAVFISDSHDFLNMLELDNYSAYSFFVANGTETVEDFEEGIPNTYSRELSSIFWMNLEQVDENRKDDFLEELKTEIKRVIENVNISVFGDEGTVLGVEIVSIFDQPENIFDGFSVELEKSQLLYFPYRGLRFDLLCQYVDECEDC